MENRDRMLFARFFLFFSLIPLLSNIMSDENYPRYTIVSNGRDRILWKYNFGRQGLEAASGKKNEERLETDGVTQGRVI